MLIAIKIHIVFIISRDTIRRKNKAMTANFQPLNTCMSY